MNQEARNKDVLGFRITWKVEKQKSEREDSERRRRERGDLRENRKRFLRKLKTLFVDSEEEDCELRILETWEPDRVQELSNLQSMICCNRLAIRRRFIKVVPA